MFKPRAGVSKGKELDKQIRTGEFFEAEPETKVLKDRVVFINRCAKVVKGGRRFSFSALVVAGDCSGHVGYGFGKAKEVSEAIRKATLSAKKNLVEINLNGSTKLISVNKVGLISLQ